MQQNKSYPDCMWVWTSSFEENKSQKMRRLFDWLGRVYGVFKITTYELNN